MICTPTRNNPLTGQRSVFIEQCDIGLIDWCKRQGCQVEPYRGIGNIFKPGWLVIVPRGICYENIASAIRNVNPRIDWKSSLRIEDKEYQRMQLLTEVNQIINDCFDRSSAISDSSERISNELVTISH